MKLNAFNHVVLIVFTFCLGCLIPSQLMAQCASENVDTDFHFDMDDCISNTITGTNMDYSEFVAAPSTSECGDQIMVSNVYRNNPTENPHSCTPGVNDTPGMCIPYERSCTYTPGTDAAVRIDVLASQGSGITGLSFYELAPEEFNYIGGISGPNDYPTLYAIRILANGTEIYSETDIPTTQEWSLETFNFEGVEGFVATEMTNYSIELTAYCASGVSGGIAVWDLDEITVHTVCGAGVDPYGGDLEIADGAGNTGNGDEFVFCVGDGTANIILNEDIVVTNALGSNETWVVTDEDGVILAITDDLSSVDFDELGVGFNACLIWNLAYEDIVGLEVGNNALTDLSGCYGLSGNAISVGKSQPVIADYEVQVESCDGSTVTLVFTSTSSDATPGSTIVSNDWLITINGVAGVHSGSPVVITVNDTDQISVELISESSTGCEGVLIDSDGFNVMDLFPDASFEATITECLDDGYIITFTDNTVHDYFIPESFEWVVTYDGITETFTSSEFSIEVTDDAINVTYNVSYTNGCNANTLTQTISIQNDLVPNFDITVGGIDPSGGGGGGTGGGNEDCPEFGGQVLGLTITGGSIDGEVASVDWVVVVNGQTYTFTGNPIDLGGIITSEATVTATVNYTNGCSFSVTETFGPDDFGNGTGFPIVLESCDMNGYNVVVSIPSIPAPFVIEGITWTITNNGVTTTSSDESVALSVAYDGSATVSLFMDLSDDCTVNITETIDTDFFNSNFDIVAGDATGGGGGGADCSMFGGQIVSVAIGNLQINGTVESVNWEVIVAGQAYTFTGNPVDLGGIITENATVTATINYSNGCSFTISETFGPDDFMDPTGFPIILDSCDDNSFNVIVSTPSIPEPFVVEGIMWTINNGGTVTTSTDPSVAINIPYGSSATVTLFMDLSDGCEINVTRDIDYDLFTDNFEIVVGDATMGGNVDCAQFGGQILSVAIGNAQINGEVESIQWEVVVGGQAFTFTGNPIDLEGIITEEATVTAMIFYSNGCSFTIQDSFGPDDFPGGGGDEPGFPYELINCDGGQFNISATLPALPAGFTYESWVWTIDIAGNVTTSTDETISISFGQGGAATVNLSADLAPDCTINVTETISSEEFAPTNPWQTDDIDCNNEGGTFVFTSSMGGVTVSWVYLQGGEMNSSDDQSLTLEIANGETVDITMITTYPNGCMSSFTESFTGGGSIDPIEWNGNPVVDCEGDDTPLIINGNPNYTYSWEPTTGLTFTDNVNFSDPIVSVTEITTYNVTVTAGDCTIEDSILVIPEELAIPDIEWNGGLGDGTFCDGVISVIITNPIDGVTYEWSCGPEFEDIIGTGVSIDYDAGEFGNKTICVRIQGANADCDISSCLDAFDGSLDLEWPNPLELCDNDTTTIMMVNTDPEQMVEIVWEEDSHIISIDENGNPTIGVGVDEDPFNLVFTASNQYGCEMTDVVEIIFTEPIDLGFTTAVEECGELTLCFTPTTGSGTFEPFWQFEDPSVATGSGSSTDFAPCYTFPELGLYDVTLSDLSDICPAEPITMEVAVIAPPTISIMDTIISSDIPVILTAETEFDTLVTITWCDENGTEIGEGNPFEYTPIDSISTVSVKITDIYDCADTVSTVVIITDEKIITGIVGPDPDPPCPNSEFGLTVEGENLENCIFLWGPEDCVVEGIDTASPIFTIGDSTKVYSVTITDTETGLDTIFDLEVAPADVQFTIIPDFEENTICEGQEGTLTAEPENLSYEWSTGESGSSITIEPVEDMTYIVTATDGNGCENIDSINIIVTPATCTDETVYVPNAFSPNNDDINDIFRVRSKFVERLDVFIVYDRWGAEVYNNNDINSGWDGTLNNVELPPDVFAYCIKGTCINGEEFTRVGNVSLLK